ncbi:MAG TPA: HAMP domain-containing sensor histidine kinase [Candidatus Acidoferrum sp.]|nr:HAMP domain-containing sensor histidine kinase [Candidatus Acidoferrum sp.]
MRSFANRLTLAYVLAAIALSLLIGFASTVFTFDLYARTSNEIIDRVARSVQQKVAKYHGTRVPLVQVAHEVIDDLGQPRINIAVFNQNHRLISGKESPLGVPGVVGAIASLMSLKRTQIPVTGGLIVVTADLSQLDYTLRRYWTLMLPTAALSIALAWLAGFLITRQALTPLTQIAAAMRRFASGDFQPEPIRSTNNDEIGELAVSYNRALHHVRAALAERDRSEAEIRQFIADAGHELRTPLTVIMGYLDVLEDGAADAPGIRERVFGTLRQESRRMRTLIEKLIYLARLERGESTPQHVVDVSTIVSRVAQTTTPRDRIPPVQVTVVPEAHVLADETDISEAVRNLLDNALKYAPGADVAVSTSIEDSEIVLTVSDSGPGMSEQDQAHAFDRFYRGRGNGDVDGSGLGLAIVKRAVLRSQGTIELQSAEGRGTQFTIRLPRAAA